MDAVPTKNLTPFLPAKRFAGGKRGYVFKMGNEGLGYYIDKKPIPTAKGGGQGQKRSSGKKKQNKSGKKQRRGGGGGGEAATCWPFCRPTC